MFAEKKRLFLWLLFVELLVKIPLVLISWAAGKMDGLSCLLGVEYSELTVLKPLISQLLQAYLNQDTDYWALDLVWISFTLS